MKITVKNAARDPQRFLKYLSKQKYADLDTVVTWFVDQKLELEKCGNLTLGDLVVDTVCVSRSDVENAWHSETLTVRYQAFTELPGPAREGE